MRARDSSSAIASTFARANEEISRAVGRMRGAVLSSAVDCECRDRVDGALRDLERLERDRIVQRLLAAADEQRRRIEALLALLADFDPKESAVLDDGMIVEAGLLFGDIAAAAELGSSLLRQSRQLRFANDMVQEVAESASCEFPDIDK
ncbi:hypothetical protein CN157_27860 [Sinorhizobium meliloti]|uniref:hypothetical protein n=1 Tax=Rhizobium meliloti TaxID=382 RepID=UPI00041B43BF|nr:hypothetical protein [Sinorhizobium meliloti]MDE3831870.1 hypothetical protein [Sinorhizobium meliloti]MDE4579563.1 hypothetical protein [Sinorhizobium meliloti]MDW9777924.1 hypothetical protein [Sinorhizobium meliloti]RVK68871.1 hypothetical protein CN157_27860 [Sinorhizobium meliloti]RVL13311.1 hypothetical protein CN149_11790 [Sinorhizobium meliloti]